MPQLVEVSDETENKDIVESEDEGEKSDSPCVSVDTESYKSASEISEHAGVASKERCRCYNRTGEVCKCRKTRKKDNVALRKNDISEPDEGGILDEAGILDEGGILDGGLELCFGDTILDVNAQMSLLVMQRSNLKQDLLDAKQRVRNFEELNFKVESLCQENMFLKKRMEDQCQIERNSQLQRALDMMEERDEKHRQMYVNCMQALDRYCEESQGLREENNRLEGEVSKVHSLEVENGRLMEDSSQLQTVKERCITLEANNKVLTNLEDTMQTEMATMKNDMHTMRVNIKMLVNELEEQELYIQDREGKLLQAKEQEESLLESLSKTENALTERDKLLYKCQLQLEGSPSLDEDLASLHAMTMESLDKTNSELRDKNLLLKKCQGALEDMPDLQHEVDNLKSLLHAKQQEHEQENIAFKQRVAEQEAEIKKLKGILGSKDELYEQLKSTSQQSNAQIKTLLDEKGRLINEKGLLQAGADETRSKLDQVTGQLKLESRRADDLSIERSSSLCDVEAMKEELAKCKRQNQTYQQVIKAFDTSMAQEKEAQRRRLEELEALKQELQKAGDLQRKLAETDMEVAKLTITVAVLKQVIKNTRKTLAPKRCRGMDPGSGDELSSTESDKEMKEKGIANSEMLDEEGLEEEIKIIQDNLKKLYKAEITTIQTKLEATQSDLKAAHDLCQVSDEATKTLTEEVTSLREELAYKETKQDKGSDMNKSLWQLREKYKQLELVVKLHANQEEEQFGDKVAQLQLENNKLRDQMEEYLQAVPSKRGCFQVEGLKDLVNTLEKDKEILLSKLRKQTSQARQFKKRVKELQQEIKHWQDLAQVNDVPSELMNAKKVIVSMSKELDGTRRSKARLEKTTTKYREMLEEFERGLRAGKCFKPSMELKLAHFYKFLLSVERDRVQLLMAELVKNKDKYEKLQVSRNKSTREIELESKLSASQEGQRKLKLQVDHEKTRRDFLRKELEQNRKSQECTKRQLQSLQNLQSSTQVTKMY